MPKPLWKEIQDDLKIAHCDGDMPIGRYTLDIIDTSYKIIHARKDLCHCCSQEPLYYSSGIGYDHVRTQYKLHRLHSQHTFDYMLHYVSIPKLHRLRLGEVMKGLAKFRQVRK